MLKKYCLLLLSMFKTVVMPNILWKKSYIFFDEKKVPKNSIILAK